jgi:NADH-quinone oxidoreductase subunit D
MNHASLEQNDDLITLNMGPHHPSTHGVLRLVIQTDGEMVRTCKPEIGYLHRSIEKIGENLEWYQFVPYTDRVDYVCSMNSNLAYALGVEALMNTKPETAVEIPLRADCIRVLFAELNRISSHLVSVGAAAMDMGAYTPFLHGVTQREFINDILEKTCGARLTYNYICIGGVMRDLHAGAEAEIRAFLDQLEPAMHSFNALISTNTIFRGRFAGVGVIDREMAIAYGMVGPNLRGAGVDWDLRRDRPYGLYPKLKFEVPVGKAYAGSKGVVGDCYDRYIVRLLEIVESIKLCRQVLDMMPPPAEKADDPIGGHRVDVTKKLRTPPKGGLYTRVENPRGETGYYIVSDGTKMPYRMKIRTGSFTSMTIFETLVPGMMVSDVVAFIGSLDIVLPEVDR